MLARSWMNNGSFGSVAELKTEEKGEGEGKKEFNSQDENAF